MKVVLLALVLNVCCLVPVLSADTVYNYVGSNFDTLVNNSVYGSSDHLSITLDLDAALGPNLNNANVSVVFLQLSVGGDTYGSAEGDDLAAAEFTTNSAGSIVDWYTYLVSNSFGFISSGSTGDSAFDFVAHGAGWRASTASIGSWSESVVVSPEPRTTALLTVGCALGLLSGLVNARSRSSALARSDSSSIRG